MRVRRAGERGLPRLRVIAGLYIRNSDGGPRIFLHRVQLSREQRVGAPCIIILIVCVRMRPGVPPRRRAYVYREGK